MARPLIWTTEPMPVEPPRTSPGRVVAGIVASLAGLVLAAFCLWVLCLMTFGLFGSSDPSVDGDIWLPLLGIAVTSPLGPLMLSMSPVKGHGKRWLTVAAIVSGGSVLLASLATWIPVALGWR